MKILTELLKQSKTIKACLKLLYPLYIYSDGYSIRRENTRVGKYLYRYS